MLIRNKVELSQNPLAGQRASPPNNTGSHRPAHHNSSARIRFKFPPEQSDECLVLDRVQKFHVCSHGLFRAGFKRFFRTSLQEPVNQNFLTGQIKNFKWNENRAPEHAENLRIKARRTSAVCSGKRSASVRGGETCEKVGEAFRRGPERRSTRTRGINITKECGAAKQQV